MAKSKITDFSFRTDSSGNMVKTTRAEYVCNVAKMLFAIEKGSDTNNPEKGLGMCAKRNIQTITNTRDSSYENEIVSQFTTYTDIIPSNVIAMYIGEHFAVYMNATYEGLTYVLDIVQSPTDLTAVIRN